MAFTLDLGSPAPDFSLRGTDGKTYSLSDFEDDRILVIVFSCNHCPYVTGNEARMKRFVHDYAEKGVRLVAVNSNETIGHPSDSFEHMQVRVLQEGLNWLYLRDDSQDTARAYGALRTPHFFVFDAQRQLAYTGRMDDQPRNESAATTQELRDAVDELLAGKEPSVPLTNPIGCNVKWLHKDAHWMPPDACDLV